MSGAGGAPEWEMRLEKKIHHNKQYRIESRRPRNYEREGLVKRAAKAPPQTAKTHGDSA